VPCNLQPNFHTATFLPSSPSPPAQRIDRSPVGSRGTRGVIVNDARDFTLHGRLLILPITFFDEWTERNELRCQCIGRLLDKGTATAGEREILLLLNSRIPSIGLSTDENRYRPRDTRLHMSGKRTTAHAAHISGFQAVPLTMRRDSALFNVDHVRGIAGLFIRELIRQLATDRAIQNGWNWMIINIRDYKFRGATRTRR
jgi:hypothetical protein